MKLQKLFLDSISQNKKLFAVLIDPDKATETHLESLLTQCNQYKADVILIGGSLVTTGNLAKAVGFCKAHTQIPIVLFPGNLHGMDAKADALLFLNLISGRNADFLISQQVMAAPLLKHTPLEVLSTSYILIDGGCETTASYISNTKPIPANKPDIAAATALAGQYIGHKCTFLDAGSGALNPIDAAIIKAVKNEISLPLLVGGGIKTPEQAIQAWQAGADVVIVGTAIEKNTSVLCDFCQARDSVNK